MCMCEFNQLLWNFMRKSIHVTPSSTKALYCTVLQLMSVKVLINHYLLLHTFHFWFISSQLDPNWPPEDKMTPLDEVHFLTIVSMAQGHYIDKIQIWIWFEVNWLCKSNLVMAKINTVYKLWYLMHTCMGGMCQTALSQNSTVAVCWLSNDACQVHVPPCDFHVCLLVLSVLSVSKSSWLEIEQLQSNISCQCSCQGLNTLDSFDHG